MWDLRRQHPRTRSPIFLESNLLDKRQTLLTRSSLASQFAAFKLTWHWCPCSKHSLNLQTAMTKKMKFGLIANPLQLSFNIFPASAAYPWMNPCTSVSKHIDHFLVCQRSWRFKWWNRLLAALHVALTNLRVLVRRMDEWGQPQTQPRELVANQEL